ncbi:C39 family peptidase [Enterococcus sp. MJM16]|uniref:C39 family peptidase n=1 Tax=Candidatus Enterococcus murrayae TaxID=2815321 RepID=A0ABS3HE17_9ENTE|nr:C39 family peptidase [Enterococcus sp. MJM16]
MIFFSQNKRLHADSSEVNKEEQTEILTVDNENTKTKLIDVPIENQNSGIIPLENGCEITALSMLLNYYDYGTNKNDLAELLNYVPVYENEAEEIRGNPHEGFVGNIYTGYEAMGVAVEPIAEVAEKIVSKKQSVVASSNTEFTDLETLIQKGTPVWVITTVDFKIPTAKDFRTWETTSGEVTVSPLCHSVVIVGVDDQNVYVNDPYGYKNRIVDKEDFENVFDKMGRQSLYLK